MTTSQLFEPFKNKEIRRNQLQVESFFAMKESKFTYLPAQLRLRNAPGGNDTPVGDRTAESGSFADRL
ncbi:hypothetical protein [uncultured Stenotrophomonas sp.]|uniref:hypothetical protein n=1 Tax=uncultured Stenotrophomonas sp. TaxID=165438 RepID=UPI0025FE1828|nr:hypothetical protein [uncultured Stenotrophomonas sp.]